MSGAPQNRRWRFDADSLEYAMKQKGYGGDGGVKRFSAESGVPYDTLRGYRGGCTQPSASFLLQMADALEIDPHDLMEDTWEL